MTEIIFSVNEESMARGCGVTLAKKQCKLDIRKLLFSQRTVNEWNRLSADCVWMLELLICLKQIDIYLRMKIDRLDSR